MAYRGGYIPFKMDSIFLLSAEGWHSTRSNHVAGRFNYGMWQRLLQCASLDIALSESLPVHDCKPLGRQAPLLPLI